MIAFSCPSCSRKLRVKDELSGRRGKCPACQADIVVPQAAEAVSGPLAPRELVAPSETVDQPAFPVPETPLERTHFQPGLDATLPPEVDDARPTLPYAAEEAPQSALPALGANLPPGETRRLGAYELVKILGQGGMGKVFQARHTKLDKIVALKTLVGGKFDGREAVARFEREMMAVGRLDHPHIVRALDAGEVDGLHYLVMEFVEGKNLLEVVQRLGALPIPEACEIVRQAAIGLQEAHEHAMVHRDIKPSNLMLVKTGRKKQPPIVKILDLGLALLSEAHSASGQGLTSTGAVMGTIDYMAPEQGSDSHQVDIRADIYSLGATLFKLLTAKAPYEDPRYDTAVKKLTALAMPGDPDVLTKRPDLPPGLVDVLRRMLAKEVDQRLATPEQVATELEPYCGGANLHVLLKRAMGERLVPEDLGHREPAAANSDNKASALPQTAPWGAPVRPQARPNSRKRVPWTWSVAAILGGGLLVAMLALIAGLSDRSASSRSSKTDQSQSHSRPTVEPSRNTGAISPWPYDPRDGHAYVWSEPRNLGPLINEGAEKWLAGPSADGLAVYFELFGRSALLLARRKSLLDPFEVPEEIPALAGFWDYNVASNERVFVMVNPDNEVWMSSRTKPSDPPGAPIRLPEPVNVPGTFTRHPRLSPDGLTLLTTSKRSGENGPDIWMFTRTASDQPFTTAERLPEPVSTPEWDMPYYISNDRCLLIASSQRAVAERDETGAERNVERRFMKFFTRAKPTEPFRVGHRLGVPLGSQNDTNYTGGYQLSDDGQSIYFYCVGLPGSLGACDLWVSRRERKPEAVAPGAVVDLLAMVELPRDSLKETWDKLGDWTREGTTLVSPGGLKSGVIQVRCEPPPEYELLAEIERVEGDDGVMFGVVVDGHLANVGIDIHVPRVAGISFLDNKHANDNETTFKSRVLTEVGKRHAIRIEVTKRAVRATVDGRKIVHWEGDPRRLSPITTLREGQGLVWFQSGFSQFKFHKLELRGKAPDLSADALPRPPSP